jgi:hypothetical protein
VSTIPEVGEIEAAARTGIPPGEQEVGDTGALAGVALGDGDEPVECGERLFAVEHGHGFRDGLAVQDGPRSGFCVACYRTPDKCVYQAFERRRGRAGGVRKIKGLLNVKFSFR